MTLDLFAAEAAPLLAIVRESPNAYAVDYAAVALDGLVRPLLRSHFAGDTIDVMDHLHRALPGLAESEARAIGDRAREAMLFRHRNSSPVGHVWGCSHPRCTVFGHGCVPSRLTARAA